MNGRLAVGAGDRVMVLAPHPDDESLAAGGLLQRARSAGAVVRVVLATRGENNPWTQRLVERRLVIGAADRERFGALRCAEARAALARLGVGADGVVSLGFPDQGITRLLTSGDARALARLADEIGGWRPTLLVVPAAFDLHPDHSALAVLAHLALGRMDPRLAPRRVLGYLMHGRAPVPEDDSVVTLRLTEPEMERKREAILCHATQIRVHRRKFLSCAGPLERFFFRRAAAPARVVHPVRLATPQDGALRLEVVLRPRPGAFGRPTLHLAADPAGGGFTSLSVPLSWRSGSAPIRRAGAAEDAGEGPTAGRIAVVGVARLEGSRRGGAISLPLEAMPPCDRIYFKIERPFGFFDEAGWLEAPAPESARAGAVCCVVPCYNVASLCGPVVRQALRHADRVIAVDDGSTDGTGEVLRETERASGGRLRVIALPRNRGKGAALLEAFRAALAEPSCDVVVALDGDGQHRPADIPRLAAACRGRADLVIGERSLVSCMPLRSRIGNTLTSRFLSLLHPACPTDTQCGFRAIGRRFLRQIVTEVEGSRYETELRILLLALTRGWRIATVPIPTLYIEGNRSSHFRPALDSLRIFAAILRWGLHARRGGGPPAHAGAERGPGATRRARRGAGAYPPPGRPSRVIRPSRTSTTRPARRARAGS